MPAFFTPAPFKRAFLLLKILFLSACSSYTIHKQPADQPIDQIVKQVKEAIPDRWQLNAKLGIRNSEKSGSVNVKWQQQSAQYHIRISGPFGQGSGTLQGNPQYIRIERANKEPIYSNNPSELIKSSFGWDLPVEHLPYWVRGLVSPESDAEELRYNSSGTLAELRQSDWSLHYSRYQLADKWLMPHKISVKNNAVTLTLIIKAWNFLTPELQTTPAG